jgi:tripartite-type tricarboxylate transporter receptor subunit TctC
MKKIILLVLGLALLIPAPTLNAQNYPTKAIHIIVPYPAGGGTDILARLVGRYLNESWKQPVVVENRPGADSLLGLNIISKAAPDGYTLGAAAAGRLNEENMAQFVPIALFAAPSYMLVVHPSLPVSSLKELIALAKAQPGKLNYGSTGGVASSRLSMELFKAMAGLNIQHIPYKGIGQAVTDLLGGQVQLMIAPLQALMSHVKSGNLKAIAVTGAKRSPSIPELPTFAEAGLPGYEATGWFGMIGQAAMPKAIVTTLNREVNRILVLPEVKERLFQLGADPAQLTPEQFVKFIREDSARWAKLIKEQGIVIEGVK